MSVLCVGMRIPRWRVRLHTVIDTLSLASGSDEDGLLSYKEVDMGQLTNGQGTFEAM